MKFLSLFLQRLEEVILVVMTGVAVTIVFINVILRYFFSYSLAWPGEIAPFMLIAVTLVGCAAAIRTGAHIRIDIILQFFPGFKKMAGYISDSLFLVYGILVLILGFDIFRDFWTMKQPMISLPVPIYVAYFFVPFSAILMIFRIVEKICKNARVNNATQDDNRTK